VLLGGALSLEPIWRGIRWLIGRGGDLDFIISRIDDPSWVGKVINALIDFLVKPPDWITLALLPAGLVLIWWDLVRRRSEVTANGTTTAPPSYGAGSEGVITSDAIGAVRKLQETPIVQSPPPPIVEAPIADASIGPSPTAIPEPSIPEPSIPRPKIKAPEKPPREFVDVHVTPEFLVGLYEGQTTLGAETRASKYKGKWMPVSGPLLETVGGWPLLRERTPVVASFASSQLGPSIIMVFHGEWIDRLAMIPKNENIFVHGQINEIGRSKIVLDPCELIDPSDEDSIRSPRARRGTAQRTRRKSRPG
jgi:hypothetical protein